VYRIRDAPWADMFFGLTIFIHPSFLLTRVGSFVIDWKNTDSIMSPIYQPLGGGYGSFI
jgi:hypothetical protein